MRRRRGVHGGARSTSGCCGTAAKRWPAAREWAGRRPRTRSSCGCPSSPIRPPVPGIGPTTRASSRPTSNTVTWRDGESRAERFFLNVVLLRVLYAHALVAAPRLALGRLAALAPVLGDPRLGMTGIFLSLSRVLPDRYPLGGRGRGVRRRGAQPRPDARLRAHRAAAAATVRVVGPRARRAGLLDCIRDGSPTYAWSYADRDVWHPAHVLRRRGSSGGSCRRAGPIRSRRDGRCAEDRAGRLRLRGALLPCSADREYARLRVGRGGDPVAGPARRGRSGSPGRRGVRLDRRPGGGWGGCRTVSTPAATHTALTEELLRRGLPSSATSRSPWTRRRPDRRLSWPSGKVYCSARTRTGAGTPTC